MRRIVTGHNTNGKSIIKIDGPPARSIGEEIGGLYEIWNETGIAVDTLSDVDNADSDVLLSPPKGGSKFRYFKIMPTPQGVSVEILNQMAEEAFSRIGAAHHRIDIARHPAMHKTKTIDYIILLEGDVTLVLDEEEVRLKPFDVVVHRGTNHAWVINGKEPATLIAVLIDRDLKE